MILNDGFGGLLSSEKNLSNCFYEQLDIYQAYYETIGCCKKAYKYDRPLGYFDRLSSESKPLFVEYLRFLNESFAREISEGTMSDSVEMKTLWRFLSHIGYRVPSNLFEGLSCSHSIEVYSSDFIQIYRNFRFMELCSYSLEDILTRSFSELFGRDREECEEQIFDAISNVLSGNLSEAIPFRLSSHVTFEKCSEENRRFRTSGKIISPLFDSTGKPSAFLVSLEAKLI